MRTLSFAKRNIKEISRDPLTLFFGFIFPTILLLLMSAIQANVPVDIFVIESLAPGISVFGLSFIALFMANLMAKDRDSDFIIRCYSSPLTPLDYILGYTLPMLPIVLVQTVFCYTVSFAFGLELSLNLLLILPISILSSFIFIALGIIFGSILTVKQVGGICGALLTNLTAWLSGIWFDLSLVGGWFENIAKLLPFVHTVDLQRNILAGNFSGVLITILILLAFIVLLTVLGLILFVRQMKK